MASSVLSSVVSSVRKSVEEEMICGICSDLLKEPKMLACAHIFCRGCLTSLHDCKSPTTGLQYEMDLDGDEENSYNLDETPENKLECPDCLQITVFPTDCSIDSLNTHSPLQDSIAAISEEKKREIKNRVAHRKRVIKDIEEGNILLCPDLCKQHEMQQEYYCTDCSITTCAKCMNESHDLHQCNKSAVLLVNSVSQLQSLIQPACEYVSRADSSLNKLRQDTDSIQANRNMCKEAVYDVFNKIRVSINEREKKLLAGIDSYVDRKLLKVAQQEKNLEEVQDQLYQSIQEIQKNLNSLLLSILVDKQRLIDGIDVQQQNILEIESSVFQCMFSSTYVGFRDDNTQAIQKLLDKLITLCEFYPDADSGYYSSRLLSFGSEEDLDADLKPHHTVHSLSSLSFSESASDQNRINSFIEIIEEEYEGDETFNSALELPPPPPPSVHVKRYPLKRSLSTPTAGTKNWLARKRNSDAGISNNESPIVPIRFDSLLLPTPILQPESIYSKLTPSRTTMAYPCGVCMGENNSIIISDIKNNCLRIVSSNGKFIGAIGNEGKGAGEFEEPCAIAVNTKSEIFVCQQENPRVQKLTPGGKYIQKFGSKSFRGNNLGEPRGIAVDSNDKVYVTDWDKSCIHIFHSNGRYDNIIGSDNSMVGQSLQFPAGIAIDANGHLIVSDRGNHCLWVLDTDGSILMRIGSRGHGPGELYFPYGVAVLQDGSIVVSESGNNRISIFSSSGKFIKNFGRRGQEPGMFQHPRHVCVTPKGHLIVADELNQRLQIFKI